MRWIGSCSLAVLVLAGAGCKSRADRPMTFAYDFSRGPQGWTAGFADYHPGEESFLELASDYRPLPSPLGPDSALFISGNNHTDDLFMFFTREVTGLAANT